MIGIRYFFILLQYAHDDFLLYTRTVVGCNCYNDILRAPLLGGELPRSADGHQFGIAALVCQLLIGCRNRIDYQLI